MPFDSRHKLYLNELRKEPVLGPVQTMHGYISKLDPGHSIVEIKRGRRRIKVHFSERHFDEIRYSKIQSNRLKVTGRAMYKISMSSRSFEDFEGHSYEIIDEKRKRE